MAAASIAVAAPPAVAPVAFSLDPTAGPSTAPPSPSPASALSFVAPALYSSFPSSSFCTSSSQHATSTTTSTSTTTTNHNAAGRTQCPASPQTSHCGAMSSIKRVKAPSESFRPAAPAAVGAWTAGGGANIKFEHSSNPPCVGGTTNEANDVLADLLGGAPGGDCTAAAPLATASVNDIVDLNQEVLSDAANAVSHLPSPDISPNMGSSIDRLGDLVRIPADAVSQWQPVCVAATPVPTQAGPFDMFAHHGLDIAFPATDSLDVPIGVQAFYAGAAALPMAQAPALFNLVGGGCYVFPQPAHPFPVYGSAIPFLEMQLEHLNQQRMFYQQLLHQQELQQQLRLITTSGPTVPLVARSMQHCMAPMGSTACTCCPKVSSPVSLVPAEKQATPEVCMAKSWGKCTCRECELTFESFSIEPVKVEPASASDPTSDSEEIEEADPVIDSSAKTVSPPPLDSFSLTTPTTAATASPSEEAFLPAISSESPPTPVFGPQPDSSVGCSDAETEQIGPLSPCPPSSPLTSLFDSDESYVPTPTLAAIRRASAKGVDRAKSTKQQSSKKSRKKSRRPPSSLSSISTTVPISTPPRKPSAVKSIKSADAPVSVPSKICPPSPVSSAGPKAKVSSKALPSSRIHVRSQSSSSSTSSAFSMSSSPSPGAAAAPSSASSIEGRARNYVCPQCDKSFLRNQDLIRHGATHMDVSERPFICPNGCGRPFGRADAAYRHSKTSCKFPNASAPTKRSAESDDENETDSELELAQKKKKKARRSK